MTVPPWLEMSLPEPKPTPMGMAEIFGMLAVYGMVCAGAGAWLEHVVDERERNNEKERGL